MNAPAPALIGMTDTRTDVTHLVTDAAMVAGRQAGRYTAVCDTAVLPASLTVPESRRCPVCAVRRAER